MWSVFMFCSNCILSSFLFKHFHSLFIIVSKLLQVWPRFYVLQQLLYWCVLGCRHFHIKFTIFIVQRFFQRLLQLWSILMFFVYAAIALLVSSVYWVRNNAPLLFRAKQSRKSTNTNTKTNTNTVWSILMFIVYAAIALLALLSCRHCPSCTPCQTQYNRGKEQMEISKCQKLRKYCIWWYMCSTVQ